MLQPFNFQKWIEEHRELLNFVGNKCVYEDSEFIIMVVVTQRQADFRESAQSFIEGDIVSNCAKGQIVICR